MGEMNHPIQGRKFSPREITELNDRVIGDGGTSFRNHIREVIEPKYPLDFTFPDPTNPKDIQFLQDTYRRPLVNKYMYPIEKKNEQILIEASEHGQSPDTPLMLLVTTRDTPVGRLYFYYGPEEKNRYERLQKKGMVDQTPAIIYVYGIISHPQAPAGLSGKILREGLQFLRQFVDEHYSDVQEKFLRVITFIDPTNENSLRAVDLAGGFQYIGSLPLEPQSDIAKHVYINNIPPKGNLHSL